MRIFRWVFYLVFFLFNSMLFAFTSYLFGKYPNLLSDYRIIHYVSGLGIILFFIGSGFEIVRYRKFKQIINNLEDENIRVKTRLSELQKTGRAGEVLTGAGDGTNG